MKLHRHTSHENDEMRTNKWPQYDIYFTSEFILYMLQKQLMPGQAYVNGLQLT